MMDKFFLVLIEITGEKDPACEAKENGYPYHQN
jgi:hypothetical protein